MNLRCVALTLAPFAWLSCAPQQSNGGAPAPARATRSGPACDSVVQRVSLHPDSFVVQRPSLATIILPPQPPSRLRGIPLRVTVLVDERGLVTPGTIRIEGPVDSAYARKFGERLKGYQFQPAVYDGCAVPAPYTFTFTPG